MATDIAKYQELNQQVNLPSALAQLTNASNFINLSTQSELCVKVSLLMVIAISDDVYSSQPSGS
jgi:hypothetical protein